MKVLTVGTKELSGPIKEGDKISLLQLLILGLQHTFTMFGATVLVPLLTGLDVGVALFTAGIGTLWFHLVTKRKVPIFLGSSFAFIAPVALVVKQWGVPAAQGGIIVAGLLYGLMAVLVYFLGREFMENLLPPVVTGPIIMVIGLNLAPVAIKSASQNWMVALIVLTTVILVSMYGRGFFKLVPVLVGLIVGYGVSLIFGIVDLKPVQEAALFAVPAFTKPEFNPAAIGLIAPVAVATIVEHVGDVLAVGATVQKDFVKDPGLHRTLIGDGIATSLAGLFGGPANTTYSENTGVLALTGVWKPEVMRVAAVMAMILSTCQKLTALIRTVPEPVIGGISIILFGMIASIGIRTVVENAVDFKKSRNLIISSAILVFGIGGAVVNLWGGIQLGGVGLAAIIGIILNQVLPKE
ncbi:MULTISPECIES: uracil-xanthine permease family protein [Thermoanaerobacter]|jgi:uracil permease|uniref:Uracil-xanthine permease n=2 Tax=Thermoanaerobacter TaxID=1754 RepID=B0K8F5_THEP3|nr:MULTISPECIES: solute carrier family 23 protein [Thermoanaerobacter]ABY93631.1 uracil-xanthine permease [Thermoanaerobacter sp. X514]ABY95887.1 uracil-xanthine permease [Thermoanaerobacter pseudethanolicus ATCC 33223]ADV80813.1 uracil-xanthine permease [Thermoanaerobacter brockii subsp. finnii Ako-1]MDK2986661.1 uracil permease [Clostridia bacterium]